MLHRFAIKLPAGNIGVVALVLLVCRRVDRNGRAVIRLYDAVIAAVATNADTYFGAF